MNKKKMYTMAGGLALVAAIGVGSTLAYFTDREVANNVVELGNVDIDLTEPSYVGDDSELVKNITPGQVIAKDPTVTNVGKNDAFIRVHVDFSFGETDLSVDEDAQIRSLLKLNDGWISGDDGYFYYQYVVKPSSGEHKVFDEVTIPSIWGNAYTGKTLHIDVTAEAVQADNMDGVLEEGNIQNWNGVGEITDLDK